METRFQTAFLLSVSIKPNHESNQFSILSSARRCGHSVFRLEVQGHPLLSLMFELFAAWQNGHSFVYLDKADVDALSNLPNWSVWRDKPLLSCKGRKLFFRFWMWQLSIVVEERVVRLWW